MNKKISITILVVVLTVAIVAGAGFLVWGKKMKKEASYDMIPVVNENVTDNSSNIQIEDKYNLDLYLQKNGIQVEVPKVDTSDWKTYTNDEYGFSFKYPKDYGVLNDKYSCFDEEFSEEDEFNEQTRRCLPETKLKYHNYNEICVSKNPNYGEINVELTDSAKVQCIIGGGKISGYLKNKLFIEDFDLFKRRLKQNRKTPFAVIDGRRVLYNLNYKDDGTAHGVLDTYFQLNNGILIGISKASTFDESTHNLFNGIIQTLKFTK